MTETKGTSKVLDRGSLLKALDLRRTLVELKDTEGKSLGSVYVRELSIQERREYNEAVKSAVNEKGEVDIVEAVEFMAGITVKIVQDEAGDPLFTEEDVKDLREKSFGLMNDIALASLELSGLTPDSIKQAKEELKKVQS